MTADPCHAGARMPEYTIPPDGRSLQRHDANLCRPSGFHHNLSRCNMADTLRLGHLITGEQHRDAIHVAVVPVIAEDWLRPGEHVGLIPGSVDRVTRSTNNIGIVDPYLMLPVNRGDRVWLFLYPGSITSLRHDWTHPAFTAETSKTAQADCPLTQESAEIQKSRIWLASFAGGYGFTADYIIDRARSHIESTRKDGYGDYITGGSEMEGEWVPDEFWSHYAVVTGDIAAVKDGSNFFSCSC